MSDEDLMKLKEELIGCEEFLKWLKNNEIFGPHKHLFTSYVQKHFPDQVELTNKTVAQIESGLENNPDFFISLGKALINEIEEVNHALLAFKTGEKSTLEKLKFIKIYWELSKYLRPVASLMTSFKQPLEQLRSPSSVFKHILQFFGFKKNDIDLIRMIRNSYGHKIQLGKDCIVLEDDDNKNHKTEVALVDIDNIYENLGNMYSWWSSVFLQLIWTHPQFGCLVLIGFLKGIKELNSEDFQDRYSTLANLNPELFRPRKKTKSCTQESIQQAPVINLHEGLTAFQIKEHRDQVLLELFVVFNYKLKPFVHYFKMIRPKVIEDSAKTIDAIICLLETLEFKGTEFSKNSPQLVYATVAFQKSL